MENLPCVFWVLCELAVYSQRAIDALDRASALLDQPESTQASAAITPSTAPISPTASLPASTDCESAVASVSVVAGWRSRTPVPPVHVVGDASARKAHAGGWTVDPAYKVNIFCLDVASSRAAP